MKYTCRDIHPGDYVLIESWANITTKKSKVKIVAENYFIDEHDDKYSYIVIKEIYDQLL